MLANCRVFSPWSDAYDPANGCVYVVSAFGFTTHEGSISIVKPPCSVVKSILSGRLVYLESTRLCLPLRVGTRGYVTVRLGSVVHLTDR